MGREEKKATILRLLDDTPDYALTEILSYLKSVKDQTEQEVNLSTHLRKILSEDKGLFERLAK